ncbi:YybH family protein [Tabrizicola sp.]|uniref:YybH family protein n=1 Tax=Tabrizicola sp. TaxID=2005166 RepID=UPI003F372EF5
MKILNSLRRFATVTALLLPLGQTVSAQEIAKVQDGLSGPVLAWVRAVESGDSAAIAAMNGPDTIAYPPDVAVLMGQQEISAAYDGLFAAYSAEVEVTDAQYLEAGGFVQSWGLYTLVLTPKGGGNAITLNGRFTDVAEAVEGGWRYIVDHASLVPTN